MTADIPHIGQHELRFAQEILRAAPAIIYVYDVVLEKSVFQNRHLGELLGYGDYQESAPQSEWQRYMHADDRAQFPAYREKLKAIKPGEVLSWEYRLQSSSGAWNWFLSRDVLLAATPDGRPHLIVGSASDITEQKEAERQKEMLADEMRHRARNFSAIVAAIARQSRPANPANALAAFDAFAARLQAVMATGNIVLSSENRIVALGVVIEAALAPLLGEAHAQRVSSGGPEVLINEHIAGGLALAIHELTTNALKYGALSVPAGSLTIEWKTEKQETGPRVLLHWKERGGPPVMAPQTEGFGTRVLRYALRPDVNGRVDIDYAPDGLRCDFAFDAPQA